MHLCIGVSSMAGVLQLYLPNLVEPKCTLYNIGEIQIIVILG